MCWEPTTQLQSRKPHRYPKIGRKHQPGVRIPPVPGDRKNYPENTRKIPQKYRGIWRGGVRIFRTQEKGKIRTTPSFALAMLILNFVGVVRGFRGPNPADNGQVFVQSWRWDHPKLSRNIPSFSQNDFEQFPRGPRRTKNTTRSKFTARSEFTIALWFAIAARLLRTPISWELQTSFLSKKGPQRSKYGGRSNSLFLLSS